MGYKPPKTIAQARQNSRYQGKIVIEAPDGLHSFVSETRAAQAYHRLVKKFSHHQVVTTVIPKGNLISMPFSEV